jgi:hypothetical protein
MLGGQKNFTLDPGLGIGDGDMLQEQAAQQILARRKKLTATPSPADLGAQGMGVPGVAGSSGAFAPSLGYA